jgi:hypothetical protein
MARIALVTVLILCHTWPAIAQPRTPVQTIRGWVVDEVTGATIPGATIILADHEPLTGTTTGPDGSFRLPNVPVGRQTLRITFIGYEPRIIRNLMVTSGREVVLEITLRESITEMEEIVVRPDDTRDQSINYMSLTGSRMLRMEEASRYAGGFDDPAGLASAFPGATSSLSSNALIIRGNAPKGVLWQMEGVEIPTPSHFANILTIGGGGITALSSHMISDSDFHTGAFPAEYGNALSGVLDLNIRTGNDQRYEHALRLGAIGVDAASEGPIPGIDGASYLANYRLSLFTLIAPLLPEDAGDIRYQNVSWKLHFPSTGTGTLSFWGIGAEDWSGQTAGGRPENWVYNQDREEIESPTRFGAMGLRHRILLGRRAWLVTSLAASGNALRWDLSRYSDDGSDLHPREYVRHDAGKLTAGSQLNFRFGARHSNRSGFIINRLGYSQLIRHAAAPGSPLEIIVDAAGHSYRHQTYSQSRFDIGNTTLIAGWHFQYVTLTGASSFEPRLSVRYRHGQNTLSAGYGRHSQTEPLSIYFSHPENRKLALAKADHLIAGYNRLITPNLRLGLEAYYQWLSQIPVISGSSFSTLNLELDWFVNERMVNDGAGRNYGLETTIERFLSDGWYALFTGSLFHSGYRGGDGIWRNTRFNRGYAFTLLGGKEWTIRGRQRVRIFGANARLNMMGGRRITPVDEAASHSAREVIEDVSRAFAGREPSVLYGDITLELRTNRRATSSVWSLQILNATAYREFYGYRYNLRDNIIEKERELLLIPNLGYKFEF